MFVRLTCGHDVEIQPDGGEGECPCSDLRAMTLCHICQEEPCAPGELLREEIDSLREALARADAEIQSLNAALDRHERMRMTMLARSSFQVVQIESYQRIVLAQQSIIGHLRVEIERLEKKVSDE